MLRIEVTNNVDAAILLTKALQDVVADRQTINQELAIKATLLTQRHLYKIAPSRHKTAERLGATPTGYLSIIAEHLEPYADNRSAKVLLNGLVGAEIFARTLGPVVVVPKRVNWLTIPAAAESYGRRARSFSDLKFIPFPSGTRALARVKIVMVPGKRKTLIKKRVPEVLYWLRKSVTLPMDRGLLPSDEEYAAEESTAAGDFVMKFADDFWAKHAGARGLA